MKVGRDFFCHIKCNIIDMFCTSFFLPSQDGLRKVSPTQEMAGYQLYMYNDDHISSGFLVFLSTAKLAWFPGYKTFHYLRLGLK